MKKFFALILAVAVTLSTTVFASPIDVPTDAVYAQAVEELMALGIVNGYEDGSFKPNDTITRAEVTKMIVAAMAQTNSAVSAAGVTKFTDVSADHWASGYINVGTDALKFINGMDNGTFAPEANVTYAQLVKMLVTSLGYGGMALQEGGYPTGYITVGDRIGVTKDIRLNANDELTRGQVAMLIDNSINIPLLVTTVWSQANPEYEIKDGKGKYFQSLLTEYHDTYKVEGKIVATSKSDTTLDSDEARFEIAVADRFDDDEWFVRNDDKADRNRTVIVADSIDPVANLFSYSTALIHKNADDEYELISLNSTAKSKTAELVADAIDDENSIYKAGGAAANIADYAPLKYYATDAKTGKVTEYKIANSGKNGINNDAQLWVNGVEVAWNSDNIQEYLVDNKVGTVTLVDAPQDGKATTDGYYDYILVSVYKSAKVSDVLADGTVYFDEMETGLDSSMQFDKDKVEDGDLQYTITLDGKEIDFKDIQEDDVIAIAYDVTVDFDDSEFYDVIVTRGTVEGKITSEDTEDETYTVGGTTYKYDEKLPAGTNNNAVGMDVTLYVDAFGRIVSLEEASSSKKFAILENVYEKSGEDSMYAKIILPDGTAKDYEIKEDNDVDDLEAIVFVNGVKADGKNPIQNRVVTYKVNSSNEIHTVKTTVDTSDMKAADDEYVAKSNKIGSVKLNDNTAILDASEYEGKVSDLKTVSSLIDDNTYTAYGYDKLSDGTYSFVLITSGIGDYTDDTQVAVFVKSYVNTNSDGDATDAITVLYNGEEKSYLLDGAEDDVDGLNKGDVIVFKLNSSNEIDEIKTIASMELCNGTDRDAYEDRGAVAVNLIDKWNKETAKGEDTEVELYYGRIVDKTSGTITLVPAGANKTTDSDEQDYDLTDNTKVYVYSYKKSSKTALYVGTTADIVKTTVPSTAKDDDTDEIDWTHSSLEWSTNYAFVKAVDGDVTEIVVVIGPGKSKY